MEHDAGLFRDKTAKLLIKNGVPAGKAKLCERTVYNHAIQQARSLKIVRTWTNEKFRTLYKNRLRSLVRNLNNPVLKEMLAEPNPAWADVARLDVGSMWPERWKALIDRKAERDENMYAQKVGNTDMFVCSRCKRQNKKANNCSYYQLQTRSADEPMTTFVSCLECGHRWKC